MSSLLTFALIAAIGWFLQNMDPNKRSQRTGQSEDEFDSETDNNIPDWLADWTKAEQRRAGGKPRTQEPMPRENQRKVRTVAKPDRLNQWQEQPVVAQKTRVEIQDNFTPVSPTITVPEFESNHQSVKEPAMHQLTVSPDQLVQGMIWAEILQKPKALRPKR